MDVDDILLMVGDFGKYQKLILWLVLLPGVIPCGFHAYNQIFMASIPDHWCYVPELEKLSNKELIKNLSIPVEKIHDGNIIFSKCLMYDRVYSNLSNIIMDQPTNLVGCKNGWKYDDTNTVITEWDLVCENAILPTYALVVLGVGGFIGHFIFGYVQDFLGRKPAFFIYLFIQCVFGIATAFANNFYVWLICRFGVGFTVPAILGTPYVLAVEIVGPNHRTLVTILINIVYSFALILLAIIVWWMRFWRIMSLITTIPFLSLFLTWWLLPESPRWLIARQKFQQAEDVLFKMASINKKQLPNTFKQELHEKIQQCKKSETTDDYGYSDLFKTPNIRIKTLIITFIWFTNTSVYVGLSYYAPALGGDEYLNFFLAAIVELPTYIFLWPSMVYWGRRWTLCLSMIIGGFACLATFLIRNDLQVTLALYCIGKMGISSSFVVLPLMASEIYPTSIRGLGISFSSVMGMIGPIIIPLINYLGGEILVLPLMIMGIMLVLGGLSSLLLPETVNRHLPQTLQDAEELQMKYTFCNTSHMMRSVNFLTETMCFVMFHVEHHMPIEFFKSCQSCTQHHLMQYVTRAVETERENPTCCL